MSPFKILDGAMGSELIKRGLVLHENTWSADANINHPDLIQQIHRDYIVAGADFITTNTFRTTPRAYAKAGLSSQNSEESVHKAKTSLEKAVELAKGAAISSTKIIGSIAPLEDCYLPNLFPGKNIAVSEFSQLGKWLVEVGVDILILETMNSLAEAEAGLIALQDCNHPIWVSFVLKNDNCLLSGDSLCDVLSVLNNYNIDMVLLNCNPLLRTKKAVDIIVDNWHRDWGIYPNLGKGEPEWRGNITEYESKEIFLSVIKYALNAGASVVGACCGSSPDHIKEIKKLI
jgi:homocysteine S-methyltransferase